MSRNFNTSRVWAGLKFDANGVKLRQSRPRPDGFLRWHLDVFQRAVWLCFRFQLSYRDVEDLLAERGVDVSYETIRRWSLKFGQAYARKLRNHALDQTTGGMYVSMAGGGQRG